MSTKGDFVLSQINAYKQAIDMVNVTFWNYCKGWELGSIPKMGQIEAMSYSFHGIGCRAEIAGQVIDFDYQIEDGVEHTLANIHGFVSHFDHYRLFNFIASDHAVENAPLIESPDELKGLLATLISEGKLVRQGEYDYRFPALSTGVI